MSTKRSSYFFAMWVLLAGALISASQWASSDTPIETRLNNISRSVLSGKKIEMASPFNEVEQGCNHGKCSNIATMTVQEKNSINPIDNDQYGHSDPFLNMSQVHRDMFNMKGSPESIKKVLSAREQFIAEKRNTSSSINAEQKLASYLASSAPSPVFDIVSSSCGDTLCEIQARVYSEFPMDDWSKVIDGIRAHPLGNDFSETSSMTFEQNGQLVAVTYLFLQPVVSGGSTINP